MERQYFWYSGIAGTIPKNGPLIPLQVVFAIHFLLKLNVFPFFIPQRILACLVPWYRPLRRWQKTMERQYFWYSGIAGTIPKNGPLIRLEDVFAIHFLLKLNVFPFFIPQRILACLVPWYRPLRRWQKTMERQYFWYSGIAGTIPKNGPLIPLQVVFAIHFLLKLNVFPFFISQ